MDLSPFGVHGIILHCKPVEPASFDRPSAKRPKPAHDVPTDTITINDSPEVVLLLLHLRKHWFWIEQREVSAVIHPNHIIIGANDVPQLMQSEIPRSEISANVVSNEDMGRERD
jgi:hypothetical protein